jgi:hypothetical protein
MRNTDVEGAVVVEGQGTVHAESVVGAILAMVTRRLEIARPMRRSDPQSCAARHVDTRDRDPSSPLTASSGRFFRDEFAGTFSTCATGRPAANAANLTSMLSTSAVVILPNRGRIDAKDLPGGASPRAGRIRAFGGFGPIAWVVSSTSR